MNEKGGKKREGGDQREQVIMRERERGKEKEGGKEREGGREGEPEREEGKPLLSISFWGGRDRFHFTSRQADSNAGTRQILPM
jgi:hypothetical protein